MPRPYKPRYRRRLPHLQPKEGTFFVTYRLHGSIPMALLRKWKLEQEEEIARIGSLGLDTADLESKLAELHWRYFTERYDPYLDGNLNGPYWLSEPEVARAVADSLAYCGKHFFHLWAYCVMSNHVHALFTLREGSPPLYDVLGRHKSFTGNVANKLLGREGFFWQHESYDHMVRNDKSFGWILQYILENPVRANLVECWEDWPWTFCSAELLPEG
ncbi:MAG: transposase [Lewinellaceae bacterium]|nr:transposase [Lewinellaceae bacterium]